MSRMRRFAPWLVFMGGLLLAAGSLRTVKPLDVAADWQAFRELPALEGGRIKPLDSLARNSLLAIRGKSTWQDEQGRRRPAIEWLAQTLLAPELAARAPVFRIDHPDLVGLLDRRNEEQKYFSLAEIAPHWDELAALVSRVNPEPELRTSFEAALVKLGHALDLYSGLTLAAQPPPGLWQDALGEYAALEAILSRAAAPGMGQEADLAPQAVALMHNRYAQLALQSNVSLLPPAEDQPDTPDNWRNMGASLLGTLSTGRIDPVLQGYAELSQAYRGQDWDAFNAHIHVLAQRIEARHPAPAVRVAFEALFNRLQPFVLGMTGYVLVFLAVCFSFLGWTRELQRGAFWLLLATLIVHTFGLAARVYIQALPPVTNLYSSAVFVGWFSVLLAVLLESIFRIGLGSMVGAIVGFVTLVIAQNLGDSGDTMEMMRAVLDSNFWLTTHVLTVTMGYSATFLAGALAVAHIAGTLLKMNPATGRALERMTYGIVCFGLLFSFVGTVLGGIWADQSWGRFWGWDPKETWALITWIVYTGYLHTRMVLGWRGKLSAIASLAGFACVLITWFGVSYLPGLAGGLHSYASPAG